MVVLFLSAIRGTIPLQQNPQPKETRQRALAPWWAGRLQNQASSGRGRPYWCQPTRLLKEAPQLLHPNVGELVARQPGGEGGAGAGVLSVRGGAGAGVLRAWGSSGIQEKDRPRRREIKCARNGTKTRLPCPLQACSCSLRSVATNPTQPGDPRCHRIPSRPHTSAAAQKRLFPSQTK